MWALGFGAWGAGGKGWGKKGGGVEHKSAGPPTPTGETYVGVVKSASAKFGFIESAETTAAYACDVFCLPNQLQGFSVGQQVQFTVGLNKDGKPQALEITAVGPPPAGASAVSSGKGAGKWGAGKVNWTKQGGGPEPTGEVYQGVIKSVSDRFGFISCAEVEATYGCDTFCLGNQLQGYAQGQQVQFSVGLNKEGKPQALEITPIGPLLKAAPRKGSGGWDMWGGGKGMGAWGGGWGGWGPWGFGPFMGPGMWGKGGGKGFGGKGKDGGYANSGGVKRKPEGTGETFTGSVKSSSAKFGFIESEEVTAKYGQDCFCLGEQLAGFNVGDLVMFEVGLSPKGQPQALSVTAIDAATGVPNLVKRPLFKMQRTA